jgi:hypothetical protein
MQEIVPSTLWPFRREDRFNRAVRKVDDAYQPVDLARVALPQGD